LEQSQAVINKLEQELTCQESTNHTPFRESLDSIKEIELASLEQELGLSLSKEFKEQIQQTTSYSQLSQLRNSAIQKHLQQNISQIQVKDAETIATLPATVNKERIILIGLLVVSLVGIGGLLLKLRGISKKSLK
jgi:hypothetical protein